MVTDTGKRTGKGPQMAKGASLNISGVVTKSEQRYGGSGGGKERCSGFLSWVMI